MILRYMLGNICFLQFHSHFHGVDQMHVCTFSEIYLAKLGFPAPTLQIGYGEGCLIPLDRLTILLSLGGKFGLHMLEYFTI